MYEMKYTFEDIGRMTLDQLNFISEGIKKWHKEEEKAIRKARSKMRGRKPRGRR